MKDLVYKDHTALDYAKMACDTLMKKFDAPVSYTHLDVYKRQPVGTGILTMPVYQTIPEADITCLDYSADMMG